jgi:hypothetical protein
MQGLCLTAQAVVHDSDFAREHFNGFVVLAGPLSEVAQSGKGYVNLIDGGRYRIRTYDIFDVNEALYR